MTPPSPPCRRRRSGTWPGALFLSCVAQGPLARSVLPEKSTSICWSAENLLSNGFFIRNYLFVLGRLFALVVRVDNETVLNHAATCWQCSTETSAWRYIQASRILVAKCSVVQSRKVSSPALKHIVRKSMLGVSRSYDSERAQLCRCRLCCS